MTDLQVDRRRFLAWISGVGAAISAALVGLPSLRAFLSPLLSPAGSDNWVKVADDMAGIQTGVPVHVSFSERRADAWLETVQTNGIWLYTDDGRRIKAYNGRCTHLGCAYGYDSGTKTFACPCHRGQYEVPTGRVLAGPPPRPLDELAVDIRSGAVWVDYKDFRPGISGRVEV
jgi:menaquinol-cytochrome c reductase iron-sulfur subunit